MVILALVILLFLYLTFYARSCVVYNEVSLTFNDVFPKLKSGDVILMDSCNLTINYAQKTLFGCNTTHVLLVWRKQDNVYLIELSPGFTANELPFVRSSNVKITNIVDKFEKHVQKGHSNVFVVIPAPYEAEITDIDVERWKQHLYDHTLLSLYTPFYNYLVCSNFIAKLLSEKGLPIPRNPHNKTTPCDWHKMKKYNFVY